MENNSFNRHSVIIAALTAMFLMLFFGTMHRILSARLSAPVHASPISPDVFKKLPYQIGEWTGQEVPLEETIIQATDSDAHISRTYSRYNVSEQIWLYVSYGVRARDLMPHRPEVCYTGNGWTLIDRGSAELLLNDGTKLKSTILQFSRGTLNIKKLAVLDYYIVDGQFSSDISLLRSKAWQGSGVVHYAAQVQITAPITAYQTADSTTKTISAFAIESAPLISQLLVNNKTGELPNNSDNTEETKIE